MAAALLSHLPGQREEVIDLAATLQALTQHLRAHRPLWSARPFVTHTVAWEAAAPAEAAWARALSEEAVEAGEADPTVLAGEPHSPVWRWVERFLMDHLQTLIDLNLLSEAEATEFRAAWAKAAQDPRTVLFGPMQVVVAGRRPR